MASQEQKMLDVMAEQHVVVFGGENTVAEPHLLPDNEGSKVRDAEIVSGALKPLKGLGTGEYIDSGDYSKYKAFAKYRKTGGWHGASVLTSYTVWNDQLVFSVEGGGGTYKPGIVLTEGGTAKDYELGITGPTVDAYTPAAGSIDFSARAVQAALLRADTTREKDKVESAIHQIYHDYTAEAATTEAGATDTSPPEGDVYLMVDPVLDGADRYPAKNFNHFLIGFDDTNVSGVTFEISYPGEYANWQAHWLYSVDDGLGKEWPKLDVIEDESDGFKEAGTKTLRFNTPPDWGKITLGVYNLYWIQIAFTNVTYEAAGYKAPRASRILRTEASAKKGFHGKYKYKFTYGNTTHGVESAPISPPTKTQYVIEIDATYTVDVTIPVPVPPHTSGGKYYGASGNEMQVDGVRIYRTVADGEEFYWVDTVASGVTTYNDTTYDNELLLRPPMMSEQNFKPGYLDESGDGTYTQPNQIAGITFHKGLFFAVAGETQSTIVWSKPNTPHAWRLDDNLILDARIQGVCSADFGLVVVTDEGPYVISGITESGMSFLTPHPVPGPWNCKSHYAIVKTPYGIMWPSRDAVVVYDGVAVRDITTHKLGSIPYESLDALHAKWYKNQYIMMSDKGTLILDFRDGYQNLRFIEYGWAGSSTFNTNYAFFASYYDAETDKLWVSKADGKRYEWQDAAASYIDFHYTTKEYRSRDLVSEKVWDRIEITYKGTTADSSEIVVTPIIDGTELTSTTLYNATSRSKAIVYLPVGSAGRGKGLQLRFVGGGGATRGTVYDAVIYYDEVKRFDAAFLFEKAVVTTDGLCDLCLFLDGSAVSGIYARWRVSATGVREYDIFFPPTTIGNLPQIRCYANTGGTTPSNNMKSVRYAVYPDEQPNQRLILRGARVAHTTSGQIDLFVDGVSKTASSPTTLTGDAETYVFCTPVTMGKRPQAIWYYDKTGGGSGYPYPTYSVQIAEWITEPVSSWSEESYFDRVQVIAEGG